MTGPPTTRDNIWRLNARSRIRHIARDSPEGHRSLETQGSPRRVATLIMFLDDDDLLRAETLDRLSDALRAHPEALAATAACRLYTENVGR